MRFAGSLRTVVALTTFGLALSSASHAASVARDDSSDGRFAELVRTREGGVIAVAPRAVEELGAADGLRTGWETFRGRHSARWSVYVDERTGMPTLVSGGGIELLSTEVLEDVTLDEVETVVRAFLADHHELLGDWTAVLELDTEASGELRDGHWQVVFRQTVDGVRVENARLDLHVNRGRLTMFGASNWGVPTVGGVPTIDAADARDFVDAYVGVATREYEEVEEPELVLMALDAEPDLDRPRRWTGARGAGLAHVLVWRLQFRDPESPALWVAEINAHSGEVRAFYDGAHYTAIRGGVYPEAPDVGCASGSCEVEAFPMPYADWTESGQAEAYTDEFGNLTCTDPGATFETNLSGQYVRVDDNCGPVSETADCDGNLRLGLKAGENCDVAPGASPGNTAAARSAYYHVNRVAEVARFYNPGNTYLEGRVTVVSNWTGVCNASYGGNTIYLYRSGTSWAECANSGEIQGIIVHEWGHGYDDNDGGGYDNTSEAYGDVVSMLAARASCFGPGLFTDGRVCSGYGDTCLTCTGFRDHDWAARQANTPATPQVFVTDNCGSGTGPCGRSVHCESYPISESIFDFATRDLPAAGMDADTAWLLAERLWYWTRWGSGGPIYTCALPDSDSCAASSWYQRMRVSDDDDADLSNGTPHAAELYAAFARHNIACGLPGDPENQSTSSCPTLATPSITVTDVSPEVEIAWTEITNADEYIVYRGDLGCNRQQVAVATLPSGTTSWVDDFTGSDLPRYYRVEAVGVNSVCRSAVSNCENNSGGPRLQMNDHRMIETGPDVNGNGLLDPGETVQVPVTLFNGGIADALGVSARLRTTDPAQGRVLGPIVDYPDLAPASELESAAPHFELTLFESGVACGDTVPLEVEMNADGAATRTGQFGFTLGTLDRDFPKNDPVLIPWFTPNPILQTLDVVEDHTIAALDVSVYITHSNASDLIVELSSPEGTTVRLHNNSGGAGSLDTRYDLESEPDGPGVMADFNGESILGTWTLSVDDAILGSAGTGTLQSWTLHVTSATGFDCDVFTCSEPDPTEAPAGFHVDKTVDGGDGSVDLAFSWSGVTGAAGYHVLHSPAPTFGAAVDVTGRTGGPTSLTVDDGAAITPPVTFFQVRAVNVCSQEGP